MSDRLLGLPDRLPSRARRWLMAVLPLALLGALVAGFALAPRPAGTHSDRPRSIGLLPPSPTTATDAPARPAPPPQTGSSHAAARPSGGQRERERSRTGHRPPVRGPVSERPPAPAPGSAEGMMLAVARRFAVAYMPYQVGRLPRLGADRVRADVHARVRALPARPAGAADRAAGGAPEGDRDLPGRWRAAGRGAGHGGGQLRLRAGPRRHRRAAAETGQGARALAGRLAGGVSGGAPAVPGRAGADDPAAAAGGDARVPRRGRRIGGAVRDPAGRHRAGRRRSGGGCPDISGRGRAVRVWRSRALDPGGDQLRRVDVRHTRTWRVFTRARTAREPQGRCSSSRAPGRPRR